MLGAVRLNLQPLPGELLRDTRVNHSCAPVNKEQKHLEIQAGVNTGRIKGGSRRCGWEKQHRDEFFQGKRKAPVLFERNR